MTAWVLPILTGVALWLLLSVAVAAVFHAAHVRLTDPRGDWTRWEAELRAWMTRPRDGGGSQ